MRTYTSKKLAAVLAAAVMMTAPGCSGSGKNTPAADADSTAAPVELSPGSAVFTDKHPLSEIDLSTERS